MKSIYSGLTPILLFLSIFLYSCGGVVPDNGSVLPAIRAGVPTVEIDGCGGIDKGLKICTVGREVNLVNLNISVQGYWEGKIAYVTSGCPVELDESFLYSRHQKIKIPLAGVLDTDCLITVTLSPRYRGFESNGVIVWPIEGHIYLRSTSRLPVTQTNVTARDVGLLLEADAPKRVVMQSSFCDINFDRVLDPERGLVEVRLSDLTKLDEQKICIINGADVDDKKLILWYVAIHNPAYNFLPKPRITYSKTRITVEGSNDVTAIILNSEYKYGDKAKFKFKKDKENILRMVTAKGRTVLGVWSPEKGEWSWK